MTHTIATLEWKSHHAMMGGERATISFPNGYGASVLRGGQFYTTGGTYEIAVTGEKGRLDYSTPITEDVLGHLTEDESNATILAIAALPARVQS